MTERPGMRETWTEFAAWVTFVVVLVSLVYVLGQWIGPTLP